jgi:hypothetical protein
MSKLAALCQKICSEGVRLAEKQEVTTAVVLNCKGKTDWISGRCKLHV